MALRDWIAATATLATPATLAGESGRAVATVATVAVASPARDGTRDSAAHYRWRIIGSRCGAYEVCFLPEATHAEVSALYPGAVVESLPDCYRAVTEAG